MNTQKTNTNAIVILPAGIAGYTWLNKADTKFSGQGEYKTEITNGLDVYRPFMSRVKAVRDAFVAEQETKGVSIKKFADFPWTIDDETKKVKIKAKLKASVLLKDGTSFTQRPALFDAAKNLIDPASVSIYSGSKLSLAVQIVPFYTSTAGAGCTLRLKAVQVLELANTNSKCANYDFAIFDTGFDSAFHVLSKSADQLIEEAEVEDFYDIPAQGAKDSVSNTNHDF